jgi:uncharacterized cupin superfamily protein
MKITVEKPSEALLNKLGVKSWPIWTKEVSTFDWHYDEKEVCYILAGKVKIKAGDEAVNFAAGDLVTFPEGLDCVWEVQEPVRKHYKFG